MLKIGQIAVVLGTSQNTTALSEALARSGCSHLKILFAHNRWPSR